MKIKIFTFLAFSFILAASAQKPKVWIITDMSDNTIPGNNHMNTVNDPDDISAMAGYLLMANMFDTRGIVVASTHRKEHKATPNQAEWADQVFGKAYAKDVKQLDKQILGYPNAIGFIESSIKISSERFNPLNDYLSIKKYNSINLLFNEVESQSDILNVLCWGSLTEQAIFVKHCISNKRCDILNKVRFIAHWTNSPLHQGSVEKPENVANCREDAKACAYMKDMALNGIITYYECGAIGQHGIVSGSPKGIEYYEQFETSELGKLFIEGKFVHNSVDHSDAATYWVLLKNWGVSLNDIADNGTNYIEVEKNNEEKFLLHSKYIHNELLRRSKIAGSN